MRVLQSNSIKHTPKARLARPARIAALACCALFAACGTVPDQPVSKRPLVWPQLPDQPRFAYQFVLRSAADLAAPELPKDKLLRELSGASEVSDDPVLDKPAAIVARQGRIYVADTSTRAVVVFDVPRRKIFRFGQRQPDDLLKPSGLALDAQQNVYVADATRRKVMVFDKLGLFLRAIGGPDDLDRPTGVGVSQDGERIYAVDRSDNESGNHKVVIYGKDGKKIKVIGTRGNGPSQFNVPLQAAVGPDGTLYVLDAGNFRVQAFDREGTFLRAFGSSGATLGSFSRPRGIAVDNEGNIYVSDAGFNNVQIFQPDGQLLLAIGQTGSDGTPGQYGLVSGVAIDETGRIYVADQASSRVEVFRRLSDQEGKNMLHPAKI